MSRGGRTPAVLTGRTLEAAAEEQVEEVLHREASVPPSRFVIV
ncbi:hypothetical protein [Natronococcus wangiae]|nr:hypothetical protein [Natronococcus sp. AD5]